MKIFNGKFGWSTSANSKNLDGTENKLYLSVQFKKGCEPQTELEGDLIFREKNGNERPCFLSSYPKKDGNVAPKLIVMGATVMNNQNHQKINNIEITSDDLPFDETPW